MAGRSRGWMLGLLWVVVLVAWAVALRRGSLVPWGTGEGPGALGAPWWSLLSLAVVVVGAAWLTVGWWRERGRASEPG